MPNVYRMLCLRLKIKFEERNIYRPWFIVSLCATCYMVFIWINNTKEEDTTWQHNTLTEKLQPFCYWPTFAADLLSQLTWQHNSLTEKLQPFCYWPTFAADLLSQLTWQHNSLTEKRKASAILLLAYFRSGSTFTADILQKSPDVFYIYEPWIQLSDTYSHSKGLCNTDLECALNPPLNSRLLRDDAISLLTCNMRKVRRTTLQRLLLTTDHSQQHAYFQRCRKIQDENICVDYLQKRCRALGVPFIKTIRLSMQMVASLLENIPGLKVIHLLRDPRGIIYSRKDGGVTNTNNDNELCKIMTNDVKIGKKISDKYPGKYLKFYYENLAQNPDKGTKLLYQFSGLQLTGRIKIYVKLITHGTQNDGFYSTMRINSSAVSMRWQRKLQSRCIRIIDNQCKELYNLTSYHEIK